MSESYLRYTDLAAAIQLARSHEMSTEQIIRALTGGMVYRDALRLAKRAAPLMDLSVQEFMRLRKNLP
jgi:hypothetical protein